MITFGLSKIWGCVLEEKVVLLIYNRWYSKSFKIHYVKENNSPTCNMVTEYWWIGWTRHSCSLPKTFSHLADYSDMTKTKCVAHGVHATSAVNWIPTTVGNGGPLHVHQGATTDDLAMLLCPVLIPLHVPTSHSPLI